MAEPSKPDYSQLDDEFLKKLQKIRKSDPAVQALHISQLTASEIGRLSKELKGGQKDQLEFVKKVQSALTESVAKLQALVEKPNPEFPDHSQNIITGLATYFDGITQQLGALATALGKFEFKPEINVQPTKVEIPEIKPPDVKVPAPIVDLGDLEKLMRKEVPSTLKKLIEAIPQPEIEPTDTTKIEGGLDSIGKILEDIHKQLSLVPEPGIMKVTNPDGSQISGGAFSALPFRDDPTQQGEAKRNATTERATIEVIATTDRTKIFVNYDAGTSGDTNIWKPRYICEAAAGSSLTGAVWQVQRLTWSRMAANLYKVTSFLVKQNIAINSDTSDTDPWNEVKTFLDALTWTI